MTWKGALTLLSLSNTDYEVRRVRSQVASTNGSAGLKSHAVLECQVCQSKEFKRLCAGLWNPRNQECVCLSKGSYRLDVPVCEIQKLVAICGIQRRVCRSVQSKCARDELCMCRYVESSCACAGSVESNCACAGSVESNCACASM